IGPTIPVSPSHPTGMTNAPVAVAMVTSGPNLPRRVSPFVPSRVVPSVVVAHLTIGGRSLSSRTSANSICLAAPVYPWSSAPRRDRGGAVLSRKGEGRPPESRARPDDEGVLRHVPSELMEAIKKDWCTDAGRNRVRELY